MEKFIKVFALITIGVVIGRISSKHIEIEIISEE